MARALPPLLLLLAATGCPELATHPAPCNADPTEQGRQTLRQAWGERLADDDARVHLVLLADHGERLTASPAIETNVGMVADVVVEDQRAHILLVPGTAGRLGGTLFARGLQTGDFQGGAEHCPYTLELAITQVDNTNLRVQLR
ncbi:MAG: hypothetical protein HY904_01580 [Deltaproteobacteria bacterium]|nr:hypothetical protein [Deltaproteobacteria bacterium]